MRERQTQLLLRASGYGLQATRQILEGTSHPDGNEQFEMLNARVDEFQARGAPVISVDTQKKELVGDFKNAGREWQPEGPFPAVDAPPLLDGERRRAAGKHRARNRPDGHPK